MKKKSLFRKITALICCLAMCFTTFLPAIAAEGSPTVTMNIPAGVELMSDDLEVINSTGESLSYAYTFANNEITFSAVGGGTLAKSTILFYATSNLKPTVSSDNSLRCRVTVGDSFEESGKNYWEIKVQFVGTSTGDYNIVYTEGVQKYNVTFASDNGLSFADTNGKTMSNGEYESGNISFTVNPRAGIDTTGKLISVYANNVKLEPTNNTYAYNVTDNVEFYATITDITYTVTEPASDRVGYTYASTSSAKVAHGGSFTFFVNPADGYEMPTVNINSANGTLTYVGNNQYVISNITGDIAISVTAGNNVNYGVIYTEGEGYSISSTDTSVYYGDNVTFTVNPVAGYEIKGVTATVDGKIATVAKSDTTNEYTINGVTGDVVINVTAQKKMCNVNVNTTDLGSKASTTAKGGSVEYGTLYTFYVTPAAGYSDAKVWVNDVPTNPVNGTQYAVEINGETNIRIAGGELNKYNVTLIGGDGFDFTSNDDAVVGYNGLYTFSVKVKDEYSQSTPVISVNGIVVAAAKVENNTYTYTIDNITENKTVSVSGLQKNTYTVTLVDGEGYTLTTTENTRVTAGDTLSFKLNVAEGYDGTAAVVKAGDSVCEKDNNGYYSFVVIGDTTVTVTGVNAKTFAATYNKDAHATVAAEDGYNAENIVYGSDYKFTVTSTEGYRVTQVSVNGEVKEAVDGVYTINNVTSNLVIKVVTVANKLTVNYVSTEKNHELNETREYTIANIDLAVSYISNNFKECIVHSFDSWYIDENTVADVDELKALIAYGDATVTLTAKFSVKNNEEIINGTLMTLKKTTKEQAEVSNGKYRTTFRTAITKLAEANSLNNPCVMDYVKVTAHGTMLANNENAGFDEMSGKLASRENKDTLGTVNGDTLITNNVFNYYTNCNYTWSDFYAACQDSNNAQIVLRINSKTQETTLNAAGWVELSIGDSNIYIISEESGTTVTAAQ